MEAEYASLGLKQIVENPLLGVYNFQHFCEFHRWIFQDMYEWAGEPRTIDVEKSEPALGGISIESKPEYLIRIVRDSLGK